MLQVVLLLLLPNLRDQKLFWKIILHYFLIRETKIKRYYGEAVVETLLLNELVDTVKMWKTVLLYKHLPMRRSSSKIVSCSISADKNIKVIMFSILVIHVGPNGNIFTMSNISELVQLSMKIFPFGPTCLNRQPNICLSHTLYRPYNKGCGHYIRLEPTHFYTNSGVISVYSWYFPTFVVSPNFLISPWLQGIILCSHWNNFIIKLRI